MPTTCTWYQCSKLSFIAEHVAYMWSSCGNQTCVLRNSEDKRKKRVLLDATLPQKRSITQLLHSFGASTQLNLSPLSPPMAVQSTKANLEKQRKTNAKSAREQRQALQMTYQVRCVSRFLPPPHPTAGSHRGGGGSSLARAIFTCTAYLSLCQAIRPTSTCESVSIFPMFQ